MSYRNEVVQLENKSTAVYNIVHDHDPPCDYEIPETRTYSSKGGVRDTINLNECPAYVSARTNDGDELEEGLYDIVAT